MKHQAIRMLFVLALCAGIVAWAASHPRLALLHIATFAMGVSVFFVASLVDWKRFKNTQFGRVLSHPVASTVLYITFVWTLNFAVQSIMPEGARTVFVNVISALLSGALILMGIRDWLSRNK